MTRAVFFDDSIAERLAPLTLTRPACELRAGALLTRERWSLATGLEFQGFVAPTHLDGFDEPWSIGAYKGVIPKGTVLVNSRCAISLAPVPPGAPGPELRGLRRQGDCGTGSQNRRRWRDGWRGESTAL